MRINSISKVVCGFGAILVLAITAAGQAQEPLRYRP
jgi:hypothetical protein